MCALQIVNPPPQDILEKVIAPVSLPGSAVGKIGMSRAAAAKEPTKVRVCFLDTLSPHHTLEHTVLKLEDTVLIPRV